MIAQLDISVNFEHWLWIWALMYGGPMLLMLIWLAWRMERKVDGVGNKIDNLAHKIGGMTKAMLMDVLSREGASDIIKRNAAEMLSKMNGGSGEAHANR